jgi:hypothetical protein
MNKPKSAYFNNEIFGGLIRKTIIFICQAINYRATWTKLCDREVSKGEPKANKNTSQTMVGAFFLSWKNNDDNKCRQS